MPPNVSGTELVLTDGDYAARIVSVGAGLASLTRNGIDLVCPHSVDEMPQGYMGKTLLPWPNRIAGGAYTREGRRHFLPVNEPDTGCALHGLVSWNDWQVIHADKDSATLGTFLPAQPGYPWPLHCWVTYAVCALNGLSVTISAKNLGTTPAPYGASSHPYLRVGDLPIDECLLRLPADTVLETDHNHIPLSARCVDDSPLDLRKGVPLEGKQIDDTFTDLPHGVWAARLWASDNDSWVELESDTRWVQIYTAEDLDRCGVAIEAMTCAPNAFNTGAGLVDLAPRQTHSFTFTIRGHLC